MGVGWRMEGEKIGTKCSSVYNVQWEYVTCHLQENQGGLNF